MSEEEIIEKIKNTIQYDKEHRIVTIYDEKPLFRDYLQGLLDLYNKEKAKNKEIRQWKYVIDTYEDLDKLKELDLIKIKDKEYISKDKIKDKIKDLDNLLIETQKELGTASIEFTIYAHQKNILQELLEEGE